MKYLGIGFLVFMLLTGCSGEETNEASSTSKGGLVLDEQTETVDQDTAGIASEEAVSDHISSLYTHLLATNYV